MMKKTGMGVGALLSMVAVSGAMAAPQVNMVRGKLVQGGYYLGRVSEGSIVTLDGQEVVVGPEGEVVLGFDRNAKPKAVLKICDAAQDCATETLTIAKRDFKTQNVKGVPPKSVDPAPEELKRMEADNAATQAARDAALKGARWRTGYMNPFVLPVDGPTSGVFGSRRTYNGQERSWHKGHDLAAKTGTPVKAPTAGVVRLARDTFMSGNLIMLDHGGGLTTVYAHLNEMLVKVGDTVEAGKMIGKVGTTGRSSGPHLHWGAYWKNVAIDPILWVKN